MAFKRVTSLILAFMLSISFASASGEENEEWPENDRRKSAPEIVTPQKSFYNAALSESSFETLTPQILENLRRGRNTPRYYLRTPKKENPKKLSKDCGKRMSWILCRMSDSSIGPRQSFSESTSSSSPSLSHFSDDSLDPDKKDRIARDPIFLRDSEESPEDDTSEEQKISTSQEKRKGSSGLERIKKFLESGGEQFKGKKKKLTIPQEGKKKLGDTRKVTSNRELTTSPKGPSPRRVKKMNALKKVNTDMREKRRSLRITDKEKEGALEALRRLEKESTKKERLSKKLERQRKKSEEKKRRLAEKRRKNLEIKKRRREAQIKGWNKILNGKAKISKGKFSSTYTISFPNTKEGAELRFEEPKKGAGTFYTLKNGYSGKGDSHYTTARKSVESTTTQKALLETFAQKKYYGIP